MHIDGDYLLQKGWLATVDGNKYYFDANGLRVEGQWLQIDGKLARSTNVEGYKVDGDGVRQTEQAK